MKLLDRSYEGGNADEYFGYTDKPAESQGFVASVSGKLIEVQFELKKTGTPTGTITCSLYTNSSGAPGTKIADINTLANATLTTDYVWYSFTIAEASAPALVAGTTYHLVLLNSTEHSSNYVRWHANGTGNFVGGYMNARNTAGTWAGVGGGTAYDANFRQYVLPTTGGFFLNML